MELSNLKRGLIIASLSDYKTNDNSGKSDGKGKREYSNAGSYKRVVLCNLEVKRHIVKERLND